MSETRCQESSSRGFSIILSQAMISLICARWRNFRPPKVTNQKIPRGNVLALRIPMQSKNEKKTFELQGKIVWASTQDKAAKIYRQAAEFINIREAQREEIIRFIFVLSRERIRS
jgi:hypothetical protein